MLLHLCLIRICLTAKEINVIKLHGQPLLVMLARLGIIFSRVINKRAYDQSCVNYTLVGIALLDQ